VHLRADGHHPERPAAARAAHRDGLLERPALAVLEPVMRSRPRSPWLAIPALGLVFLLALGCENPFKPADPELPSGEAVPENFLSPAGVLPTRSIAIETRTVNGANAYIHAFSESTSTGDRAFRAFYDDGAKRLWQGGTGTVAPEPWDITRERGLHTRLAGIRP